MKANEAIKYLQQLYPNGGHCWLDEQRIEAIGMAVKALQEEPASKDKFTFTSLPRLLDRIKPTDRAKWYSSRLADALEKEGYITDAKIVRESIKLMNGEKVPMATMDEEPVSEDLEEEMDNYLPTVFSKDMDGGEPRFTTWFKALRKTAIYFSKWQKEQMMAKAIDGKVIANGMGNPILHLWDKGRHFIGKKVKVIVIEEG